MLKKFTIEEVNELTNNGYEEEMAWLFAERLNDALDNEEHIVPCQLPRGSTLKIRFYV